MIPLKTDRPIRSPIVINYALIVANIVAALVLVLIQQNNPRLAISIFTDLSLHPTDPKLWQFVSYQFLHDQKDIWHLGFNMLFLWVFGNSLEDRLGRIGYLAFYLAGGVFAGLAHCMFSDNPVVGASGSISAVTGAYLALFPRSKVLVLWVFIIITWFHIPSLWFIGISFARDLFGSLSSGGSRVAYGAHLGGNVLGFVVGMALLWARLLPREPYDMVSLWQQARRRRRFKAATAKGDSPWRRDASRTGIAQTEKRTPQQEALDKARAEIARLITDHKLPDAAGKYRELLHAHSDVVFSEQMQLDLANQFFSDGDHQYAAKAYELFLSRYASYRELAEIKLILGLIYARYVSNPSRARELLTAARDALRPGAHHDLAEQVLKELA
ncbi:MAG: rhomboid family intramembrane serine protease [Phycisphaerales bacterium]|nr:rhomboid family intramembrane serine protease [Phycisphaerales bacterium]